MSISLTHAKRIERLIERVKAYATSEGIEPTTASSIILGAGKELERLQGSERYKKGSTKPATLEKYEYVLARMEKDTRKRIKTDRYERARQYAAEFAELQADLQPVSAA